MEAANIDLIPFEEKASRAKEKTQKLSLVISAVLFVLVASASAGIYYYIKTFDTKITNLNSEIEKSKQTINEKAEIEVLIRTLDSKYNVLTQMFADKYYYSVLVDEISIRVPDEVSVISIDASTAEKVNLTGDATNYVALAKFLNTLADPSLASKSVNTKENNLFKQVTINSVTLDAVTAKAKFNLMLDINTSQMKKE